MRLFFSLVLLLFVAPVFLLAGSAILMEGPGGVGKLSFGEVADVKEGAREGVVVEGRLLRLGSPDDHRSGSFHQFPFVDAEVDSDPANVVPGEVPVVVRLATRDVPAGFFRRSETGTPALLSAPIVVKGARKRRGKVGGKLAHLLFPDDPNPGERQVILINVGEDPPGQADAVMSLVIGALALLFGLKMLRTWRRRRKEDRIPGGSGRGSLPAMDFGGGCAKVAGGALALLIGIGVVAARVGSKAAPAVDNVARSAARSADEVARAAASGAAKAADGAAGSVAEATLSAGEFALSNVGNLKTAYEIQQKLGREPSGTMRGTYTYTRIQETYGRTGPATFDMESMRNEYEMTRAGAKESGVERDGPNRALGEFERLRFERSAQGAIELHVSTGVAGPGGWVDAVGFSVPVEFVEGDWDALTGDGRAVLRLAEGASKAYGRGHSEVLGRIGTAELIDEGYIAGRVTATAQEVPTFEYVVEGNRLEIDCQEPLSYFVKIVFWR